MASKSIRLLLVGAHPADTFDTAGGTLAHHVAKGDQVTLLAVTPGVRSHNWQLLDQQRDSGEKLDVERQIQQARDQKMAELKGACEILGLKDVRTLHFEDDEELLRKEMVDEIARVIREVRPQILITHHPYEDWGLKLHATVGRATMFAYRKAAGTGRGRSEPSHIVSSIYFMCPTAYVNVSLNSSFAARVDLYVDITDVVEKKVRAMDFISSQYYQGNYARKIIEDGDGYMGDHANVSYAESFQRYRPWVSYTLPISDFEIECAEPKRIKDNILRRSTIIAAHVPLPKGEEPVRFITDKKLYNW